MRVVNADSGLVRVLRTIGIPGQVAILALMLHVTLDTVLRKTTGQPITGTLEYVQYWYMPAICLLGFITAELQNDHITAPVIYDQASPRVRREFSLFAGAATIAVLLAYAWWGLQEAIVQLERGASGPISGIVIWPAVFLVPLASVGAAIAVVITLRRKPWLEHHDVLLHAEDRDSTALKPRPAAPSGGS